MAATDFRDVLRSAYGGRTAHSWTTASTAGRIERAGIEVAKDVRSGPAVENILDFAEDRTRL